MGKLKKKWMEWWIHDTEDHAISTFFCGTVLIVIIDALIATKVHRFISRIYEFLAFAVLNGVVLHGSIIAYIHAKKEYMLTDQITRLIIWSCLGIVICTLLAWLLYWVRNNAPDLLDAVLYGGKGK